MPQPQDHHKRTKPLMKTNLHDPREDLDDFEVGLTYKTPVEPDLFEK